MGARKADGLPQPSQGTRGMRRGRIMADFLRDMADNGSQDDTVAAVERIAQDLVEDIEHGRVRGDTAEELERRLKAEDIELRPEAVEALADDVEEEASR
jgi:hypothetical protein